MHCICCLSRESISTAERPRIISNDFMSLGARGFRPGVTQTRLYKHRRQARGLKFRIQEVGGLYMYYLCSKNKGVDQLRSYCAVDLRLCF